MKVSEVLRLLHEDGWFLVATRGSHRQFKYPQKSGRATVPGEAERRPGAGHTEQHSETGWLEEVRR